MNILWNSDFLRFYLLKIRNGLLAYFIFISLPRNELNMKLWSNNGNKTQLNPFVGNTILNLIRLSDMLVSFYLHIFTYPTICIEFALSRIIYEAKSHIDCFYRVLISYKDVAYLSISFILLFTLLLIDLPTFISWNPSAISYFTQ